MVVDKIVKVNANTAEHFDTNFLHAGLYLESVSLVHSVLHDCEAAGTTHLHVNKNSTNTVFVQPISGKIAKLYVLTVIH